MNAFLAISIRQPFTHAITHLDKRIENRSRSDGEMPPMVRHRGPLYIHASSAVAGPTEWLEIALAISDRSRLPVDVPSLEKARATLVRGALVA